MSSRLQAVQKMPNKFIWKPEGVGHYSRPKGQFMDVEEPSTPGPSTKADTSFNGLLETVKMEKGFKFLAANTMEIMVSTAPSFDTPQFGGPLRAQNQPFFRQDARLELVETLKVLKGSQSEIALYEIEL